MFIHPSIHNDELQFTRAKALLILLLFFLFVLVCYTGFFVFHDVLFNIKALLNYLGIIAISLSLLMLKKSKSLISPIRVINYAGIGLITGGVYWSGGFASNDILWYIVLAISSLLFIGKVDGIIQTVVALVAIGGFYAIDIFDLMELPYDPLTRSIHYRFANAVIIVLILFFLVWVQVNRNQRLQLLIQKIQNSQMRESISRDFHDELGNKLASVVHLSKRLKDPKNDQEGKEMLGIIEKESQDVYDNFRDFIWVNDPNNLNITALFVHLTDFNQQFFAHKDIEVDGQLISDPEAEVQISTDVYQQLVPIFKELMTNIYKHANAQKVHWSIQIKEDHLVLDIQDDGIGFDQAKIKSGQGLKSIEKRSNLLNADYKMVSSSENGTLFTLRILINQ